MGIGLWSALPHWKKSNPTDELYSNASGDFSRNHMTVHLHCYITPCERNWVSESSRNLENNHFL